MAVVPMKFVTLAGPVRQFDTVVRHCIINRQIHLERVQDVMRANRSLRPLATSNPYSGLFRQGEALAQRLGYEVQYVPFDAFEFTQESVQAYFNATDETLIQWERNRQQLQQQIAADENVLAQMERLSGIDVDLSQLRQMKFIKFRFGHMTRETFDSFYMTLQSRQDLLYLPTKIEPTVVYGLYFAPIQTHNTVDLLFNSLHFVRVDLKARAGGTTAVAIESLTAQIAADKQTCHDIDQQMVDFQREQEEKFLAAHSYLRWWNEAFDVRRYAAQSKDNFYLVGWVPEDELPKLTARFDLCPDLSYVVDDVIDQEMPPPPTKLKQGFLARVFEPFLLMYGLPAYNELDPSAFMAFTYCLFAGIMFGDVGQGICLILAGLALWRFKGMWLGRIIACCGVSSTIFGFVYGSVFGFEHILPGFKALEGQNVIYLLLASMALGVAIIFVVMVFNIINGVRQRNPEKWLFSPNGLCGMLFYFGLIGAALSTALGGPNLFTKAYVLPVLVAPLILILLREPLSKLMAHEPDWKPESIGGLLVTGFFELFETLLSYFTNTLSFLRIGAYAITHVGLMMVVHLMAGADLNPLVLILGNLFVLGFEGMLVGIQVLRLEFYELFGRFYDDGGRAFAPRFISTSTKKA